MPAMSEVLPDVEGHLERQIVEDVLHHFDVEGIDHRRFCGGVKGDDRSRAFARARRVRSTERITSAARRARVCLPLRTGILECMLGETSSAMTRCR